MKKIRISELLCASSLLLVCTQVTAIPAMSDYMVITTMDSADGDAFIMSDSEIGAIGTNGSTSPPGSLPTLPGGTTRTVSTGITLDGDVAVTNGGSINLDGKVSLSNSDVHAVYTGDANPGSQGIDCSANFANCTLSGGNISSNNQFNQSSPTASFSTLAENNGIQGNIDLTNVTNEINAFYSDITSLSKTGEKDLTSTGGNILNDTNAIWDFSGDGFTGINIIDIITGGSDFSIKNSNLTIKGDAGDTIIFRVEKSWIMDVSESNLLLDGGIGDNNVLWFVDADEGEGSFTFNNVTFYGMSLWDIDPNNSKNVASFNNVQFCGQVVTDQVNFQNVSGSGCAYTATVPEPSILGLMSIGLIGLIGVARHRKI